MNCVKVFDCPVASLGGCFNLEEHVKYWLNLGKPTHGHNFLLLLVLDKMLIFFIDGIQTICFDWMLFDTCCCFVQEIPFGFLVQTRVSYFLVPLCYLFGFVGYTTFCFFRRNLLLWGNIQFYRLFSCVSLINMVMKTQCFVICMILRALSTLGWHLYFHF